MCSAGGARERRGGAGRGAEGGAKKRGGPGVFLSRGMVTVAVEVEEEEEEEEEGAGSKAWRRFFSSLGLRRALPSKALAPKCRQVRAPR